MIDGIRITKRDVSRCTYTQEDKFEFINKLSFFKDCNHIKFKPGVNIIFGQNGTGKSTILNMIAMSLAAKQGGISKLTHKWTRDYDMSRFVVDHDGQPIMYCDTKTDVGLIGGMAGFDNDFFSEGVKAIKRSHESSGLTTLSRLTPIIDVLFHDKPMPDKIASSLHNDEYDELIKGTIDIGQKTILIDEPESGLSYVLQSRIIPRLIESARNKNIQLIIATHSPYALEYDDSQINFIEMEPGFIANTRNALKMLKIA